MPETVPLAAVAVTTLLLDDVTDRADNGPTTEFNDVMSEASAVTAVWIAVNADVWLVSVACSACQMRSGARAAYTPAATAAVTSMPGVVAPTVAARIELTFTAEAAVALVELRSELTADTELMAAFPFYLQHHT